MTWARVRTKLTNAARDLRRAIAARYALYVDLAQVRRDLIAESEHQAEADRGSRVLRVSGRHRVAP